MTYNFLELIEGVDLRCLQNLNFSQSEDDYVENQFCEEILKFILREYHVRAHFHVELSLLSFVISVGCA